MPLHTSEPKCTSEEVLNKVRQAVQQVRQPGECLHPSRRGNQPRESLMLQSVLASTVASSDLPLRKVQKQLGVGVRALANARAKRARDQCTIFRGKSFWSDRLRASTTALPSSIAASVHEFWKQNTVPSPSPKDILRKRISPKVYETHSTHFLTCTQSRLYRSFKKANPDLQVGQRVFEKLKPYWVRVLKLKDRQVCMCRYHVNFAYVTGALHKLRQAHPGEKQFGPSPGAWASAAVCLVPVGEEHPRLACVRGECKECGTRKLIGFSDRLHRNRVSAEWKKFEEQDVTKVTRAGKEETSRVLTLVVHRKTAPQLVEEFHQQAKYYILHRFENHWQRARMKEAIQDLEPGVLVTCLDFSENFSVQFQNEIQSLHWIAQQITLLVCVAYWDVNGETQKWVHCFVSDDLKHDVPFVGHCRRLLVAWYNNMGGPKVNRLIQCSDGCASQFKCLGAFYDASCQASESQLDVTLLFSATSHGKSEFDSAGGHVKSGAAEYNLRTDGAPITCARAFVDWARDNISEPEFRCAGWKSKCTLQGRQFWLIEAGDVAATGPVVKKIKMGTLRLHEVRATIKGVVWTRDFSCVCTHCVSRNYSLCPNSKHAEKPQKRELTLERLAEQRVTRHDTVQQGFELAGLTAVGDVCAVVTDLVDEPYWLLLVTKCVFTATEEQTGAYGTCAEAAAHVVRGRYFTQLPGDDYRWALDGPTKEVVVYGHLIRFTPVPLTRPNRRKNVWTLEEADHEAILCML